MSSATPLFLDLCLLNDRLMALLPWETQERAKTSFELQMIQTEDITLLAERQVSLGESSLHRKIAMASDDEANEPPCLQAYRDLPF
jgi:hypothetical protein